MCQSICETVCTYVYICVCVHVNMLIEYGVGQHAFQYVHSERIGTMCVCKCIGVKVQPSAPVCQVPVLKEARAPSSCLPEIGASWTKST